MGYDTTNEQREERAYRLWLVYQQYAGVDDPRDAPIQDAIADLLHLAERYDGAEETHRMAWSHFTAERRTVEEVQV